MSKETSQWLNQNTLIGFTDKRGNAWHYRASDQGVESNHYTQAVPIKDVRRRLFNFTAEERPFYVATEIGDDGEPGGLILVEDRKAIIRSDNKLVMGVFKGGYTTHQPDEWLIGGVANLVGGEGNLGVASAGLLKGGAQAWVQIEAPENVSTPEGFAFRPYITASTSFDGSLATTYARGAIAVVCDNTLAWANSEAESVIKIKHSKYSVLKLESAREALEVVNDTAEQYTKAVANLAKWEVSTRAWNKFLDATAPVPTEDVSKATATKAEKKRDRLEELYNFDNRVAPWKGTALGVVQAVNTYAHHDRNVRGADRAERNAENAINGATAKLDAQTIATLAEFAPAPEGVLVS
jgi:phage/plasmid-like protein (TIGR03299 family)